MEQKKPDKKQPAKRQNRAGIPTLLYFDPVLREPLQALAAKHDRAMAREIERALRAWLYLHDVLPKELELPEGLPKKNFPK